MALQLSEVILGVRLRHPLYADPQIAPARVLADAAGRLQRRLALMGTQKYSGFLEQQAPIYLQISTDNQPGTVAAGSSGGLPSLDSSLTPRFATAGAAPYYDFDVATVQVADFVPTTVAVGATQTTITLTGAGRTIDADIGLALLLVEGPGAGPASVRTIEDNTATTWVVDNFETSPTTATLMRIVTYPAADVDGTSGVMVGSPGVQYRAAYLVKLSAIGVPYLDLTEPLIATLRAGITLPPFDRLRKLEAVTRPSSTVVPDPLVFPYTGDAEFCDVPLRHGNHRSGGGWGAWVEGTTLHLNGPSTQWANIRNLVLSYVPIPPLFSALRTAPDEYFLLPDTAYDVLVAGLAVTCAQRAAALGRTVDIAGEQVEYAASLKTWLRSIGSRGNALIQRGTRNR